LIDMTDAQLPILLLHEYVGTLAPVFEPDRRTLSMRRATCAR